MSSLLTDDPLYTVGAVSAQTRYPSGLSWDEFLALPQETRNAALIDGEVIVDSPNAAHEVVVRNLSILFTAWTRGGLGRGEVSTQQPVKAAEDRGYQPDFAWYPAERCPPQGEDAFFTGLPELIVEVFSPSTRYYDLKRNGATTNGLASANCGTSIRSTGRSCSSSEPATASRSASGRLASRTRSPARCWTGSRWP